MFAQSMSSTPTGSPLPGSSPRTEPAASSGRFSEVLTQQMGANANVDQADEDDALRELFHILAMLSTGRVDGSAFKGGEAKPGSTPGPARTQVENVKAIIRRLVRGGAEDASSSTDPQAKGSDTSLRALFQSLPTEIQNLLRRAFPNADQLLADESQKLISVGLLRKS